MAEDSDLLRAFVRGHSNDAFSELVRRHLDFVYQFALSRVGGDTHAAQDVTQSVFIDLARRAPELQSRISLTPWLYTSTRFAAAGRVRAEQRRRKHEQEAHTMQELHSQPEPAWRQLEPVLSEALDTLGETDRNVLLMRFFERRSLADLGRVLAISEDAARMRVNRALDRMRSSLSLHGITSTSAALSVVLATPPAFSAPAALAGTVAAAVWAALPSASLPTGAIAIATTQFAAMTALKKTALLGILALAAGAGFYEIRSISLGHKAVQNAEREREVILASIRTTREQRAETARDAVAVRDQLAVLQAAADASKGGADPELEEAMRSWFARVDRLQQMVTDNPQWAIPELQLLTDDEWFEAAQEIDLETEQAVRETLRSLRDDARFKLARQMFSIVNKYVADNNGILPSSPSELFPYFDPPIDPAILNRYESVRSGRAEVLSQDGRQIVIREIGSVDPEYDSIWLVGLSGFGNQEALKYYVERAQEAFSDATGGENATYPAQLLPYLRISIEPEKLFPFLQP